MLELHSSISTGDEKYLENEKFNTALVDDLNERILKAATGGREDQIQRHHKRGKYLPRERIEKIIDPGSSFLEFGM